MNETKTNQDQTTTMQPSFAKKGPKNAFFQAKLSINEPNDPYEQEADAMAEQVMRMPISTSGSSSFFKPHFLSVQRACQHCEEEEKKKIQRKEAPRQNLTANENLGTYVDRLSTSGQPLPQNSQQFFESRFGQDFSGVKIHTDHDAATSAASIQALAYTIGPNIVFNEGQFAPETEKGKRLLAHELTHVVQQSEGVSRKIIQRASYATQVYGLMSQTQPVAGVGDFPATYQVLSPLNSTDMLDTLDDLELQHPRTIDILLANLNSATGPVDPTRMKMYFLGVKNARYQNDMTSVELQDMATNMTTLPLDQQTAIQNYISSHRSSVSQDLYQGTHIPTAAEQAAVETQLNPGTTSTITPGGAVTITSPTPDPVCANAANLEARIRTVLVPVIHNGAVAFRTKQAAPPAFPIAQANTMADLAQREVERYYEPYLARASRSGVAGTYQLGGTVRASGLIRDQSTSYQRLWNTVQGRLGWLKYWYEHQTNNLNDTLHCDTGQLTAALNGLATDSALEPDIRDYIDGWPAEATQGINIQPYTNASICQRWDTFTTIIHEFLHILAHPNFEAASQALPNSGLEALKEGLDDVLRKELWEGAGNLRNILISPARNADRAIIEGATNPLDLSQVCNHGYYDNLPKAESITTTLGRNNIKLAYFLGQTEYLGLGAGSTLNPNGSLTGVSLYNSTDAANMDQVTLKSGETREQLILRTHAAEIRDTSNNVIPDGTALPAVVRIPGVRHIYVHADDSLTSIAVQNGVTPYEIMLANSLTSTSLTVGSRILIPRHP